MSGSWNIGVFKIYEYTQMNTEGQAAGGRLTWFMRRWFELHLGKPKAPDSLGKWDVTTATKINKGGLVISCLQKVGRRRHSNR